MANVNSTVFNFFVADNEHIRRLLKLRLTYFISDFFGSIVNLYADTVFFKFRLDFMRSVCMAVGNRKNDCLLYTSIDFRICMQRHL